MSVLDGETKVPWPLGPCQLCEVVWTGLEAHLIHCGSSVTVSPGVTMAVPCSRARLAGRAFSVMSTSPSESREASSGLSSGIGEAGAGGNIDIAMYVFLKLRTDR